MGFFSHIASSFGHIGISKHGLGFLHRGSFGFMPLPTGPFGGLPVKPKPKPRPKPKPKPTKQQAAAHATHHHWYEGKEVPIALGVVGGLYLLMK